MASLPELGGQASSDDIVRGCHALNKLSRDVGVWYIGRQIDCLMQSPIHYAYLLLTPQMRHTDAMQFAVSAQQTRTMKRSCSLEALKYMI